MTPDPVASQESPGPHAGTSEVVESSIHGLSSGGDGVGRLPDGRVVFVPFAAPGDRVRLRIVESKRRYARGALVEVLEASREREEPRCPHFGECGGCAWQHVAYPAQLEAKREIAVQALRRIGRLDDVEDERVEVHASPEPYAYRGRARMVASQNGLGYRRHASHEITAPDSCAVLRPALDRELKEQVEGELEGVEVELFEDADGRARRAHRSLEAGPGARWSGPTATLARGELRLRISPGVFAQANALLRDRLAERVVGAATEGLDAARQTALELYAGAGFFSLDLARAFSKLTAVESAVAAAEDLVANAAATGLGNLRVMAEPVERALDACSAECPAVVVLDPPRTGLPRAVAALLGGLGARRLVYLSCDPATQARDLAVVRSVDPGYRTRSVEIFDLFPQTPHVESLVVLERGD